MDAETIYVEVDTDDQMEHAAVLSEAMRIYMDRDAVRGDLWRNFPPTDKFKMIREKTDRAVSALARLGHPVKSKHFIDRLEHEIIDSMLDTINFAVFAIRQVRDGQRG